jgi:uncharacterized membrane protein YozB (DUF420 family)
VHPEGSLNPSLENKRKIKKLLMLMTALLGIQFVAGIYVNSFYGTVSGNIINILLNSFRYPVLAFHIILAVLTFIVSAYTLLLGFFCRLSINLQILLGMNSLSISGAGISGIMYLSTKASAYSFSMAILWLLAFAFIGFGQTFLRSSETKAKG